ncbi:MAG: MotA/TolQ/ExbB proton channel family protein [Myxococcota bacterium]
MTEQTRDPRFFSTINRSALAINQSAAGAGLTGLLGFVMLFVVAAIFFITEAYFVSMLTISLALLVYVTGAELTKLLLSSVTIFFSSKHLTPQAGQLQETLVALQSALEFRRDDSGQVMVGAVEQGSKVRLPDNTLARDIQEVVEKEKSVEYADYVAHTYYVECHELYDYSAAHFEFVSGAMPLFGLIGTIVGLIAMFDSLGGDVSVEALSPQLALALKTTLYGAVLSSVYRVIGSRFEQRLKSLDYDVETFTRALQVVIENRVKVEVQ